MRRGRSRAATLDDIADARARAADTISDLADHAVAIAREAGNAARPTVKQGAEGLSRALERAAGTLAETAEHLANDGRVSAASNAARERIADASGKLSTAIRPKRKTHRVRNLVIGAAVIGGIFALVQSPLRSKIQERLFGPAPEDDDLPQITLPDDDHEIDVTHASDVDVSHASAAAAEPAADVVGTAALAEQTAPHRGRGHGHSPDDPTADQETNA
jgi:hypothetical protein